MATALTKYDVQHPLFSVQVNLWHSTVAELLRRGLDIDPAMAQADTAVKAFTKRFPAGPRPTKPEPVEVVVGNEPAPEYLPQNH